MLSLRLLTGRATWVSPRSTITHLLMDRCFRCCARWYTSRASPLLAPVTSSPSDHLGRWHVAGEQLIAVSCLLHHRVHVVSQHITFGHQRLCCLAHTLQIVCYGWIAFGNGETRIPHGFPLALRRREGQRRPHQPHEVIWRAHCRMTHIPSCIRRQRDA